LGVVSEQQEHPEGTVAAESAPEPQPEETQDAPTPTGEAPVDETPVGATNGAATPAEVDPSGSETPPAEDSPAPEPAPDEPVADAAPITETAPGTDAADAPASASDEPVGPKILGVAEEKKLPVVKKRLQEKPKREPLPWPELRAAVAATKDDLDVNQLKELFRGFPEKLREEVTENVRGFKKGARRPVSQHAAKQLARASHTARRMKKNAHPSGEVAQALGQAMAAELIASLEPEKAAQVILPKRDLLERESRQAQRRARDEEDKRRDEQRRKRREDAKSSRQQTSFGGGFGGAKIQGLDQLAALFADQEPQPSEPETPEAATPAAEPEAPVTPATTSADDAPAVDPQPADEAPVPAGEPEAPVTPATTAQPEEAEAGADAPADAEPTGDDAA
jgi:translation initiation factor 5B